MNLTLSAKKGGVQTLSASSSIFMPRIIYFVVLPFPDYDIFIEDLPDPMIRDTRCCISRSNFHVISVKFLDLITINT
jgi:hypothetical protein